MRERAIGAAILVPVLLVVLAFGGAVLALAIAIITAVAALELFRLLRAAGHESVPGARHCPRPHHRCRRGLPGRARRERPAAVGDRDRAHRGRRVHPPGSAGRPGRLDCDGVRCVLCLADGVRHPPRPCGTGRAGRRAARGARRGAWLDPAPDPRRLVVRHGGPARREAIRPGEVPDPHLPVEDVRRTRRRDRRIDKCRDRAPVGTRPTADPWPAARPAGGARGPGRRSRRIDGSSVPPTPRTRAP